MAGCIAAPHCLDPRAVQQPCSDADLSDGIHFRTLLEDLPDDHVGDVVVRQINEDGLRDSGSEMDGCDLRGCAYECAIGCTPGSNDDGIQRTTSDEMRIVGSVFD
jgi:hypothetical protein